MDSKLIKEKSEYVAEMARLFKMDKRSEVESMHYEISVDGFSCDERLKIRFKNGLIRTVNISCNSCYAILKAAMDAVY